MERSFGSQTCDYCPYFSSKPVNIVQYSSEHTLLVAEKDDKTLCDDAWMHPEALVLYCTASRTSDHHVMDGSELALTLQSSWAPCHLGMIRWSTGLVVLGSPLPLFDRKVHWCYSLDLLPRWTKDWLRIR